MSPVRKAVAACSIAGLMVVGGAAGAYAASSTTTTTPSTSSGSSGTSGSSGFQDVPPSTQAPANGNTPSYGGTAPAQGGQGGSSTNCPNMG